jgi:antitoxin component of RelBE/YafQ-DinJ toxin-antitoxin module
MPPTPMNPKIDQSNGNIFLGSMVVLEKPEPIKGDRPSGRKLVPNRTTIRAMKEARSGMKIVRHENLDDLFDELNS